MGTRTHAWTHARTREQNMLDFANWLTDHSLSTLYSRALCFSCDLRSRSLCGVTTLKIAMFTRNLIPSSKFSLVRIPHLPGNLLAEQRSTNLRVSEANLWRKHYHKLITADDHEQSQPSIFETCDDGFHFRDDARAPSGSLRSRYH